MKRYYQLVMVVVTGLSLLCFLFYKHEYERLRKVLEILDIFGGSPDVSSKSAEQVCQQTPENWFINPDFWRTTSSGLNIFGVLNIGRDNHNAVAATAFTKKQPRNPFSEMSCFIETENLVDNIVAGNLSWIELESSLKLRSFLLTCTFSRAVDSPFVVGFTEKNKVHYHPVSWRQPQHVKDLVLCIVPPSQSPFRSDFDLIEFILFYNMLGVNMFYIYHYGMGQNLLMQLKDLAHYQNVHVNLVTWNRPGEDTSLDSSLISTDCYLRNGAELSGPIVTVKSGEFLVLEKDTSLEKFLNRAEGVPADTKVYELKLPLMSLCSNIPDMSESNVKLLKILKRKKKLPTGHQSGKVRFSKAASCLNSTKAETQLTEEQKDFMVNFVRCPVSAIEEEDQEVFGRFSKLLEEMPYVKRLS